MKQWMKIAICMSLSFMCLFACVGYAMLGRDLTIGGDIESEPSLPDIYISSVIPTSSVGVHVTATSGTVFIAKVSGSGKATFTVTVKNISDKIYVYERTIDGAETGIEGAYTGTDITYTVSNISPLDEVNPDGGTRSFQLEINVPSGARADQYILYFKFIEKQGSEILPGNDEFDVVFKYNNGKPDSTAKVHYNDFVPHPETPVRSGYRFIGWYTDAECTKAWNFDTDRVESSMTLYAGWERTSDPIPTSYRVTFKYNNGDPDITATVSANSLIPIPTQPTLEGYSFIGWYTDASCTAPWNFDTDKITSDMVLYGGWEVYVPPVPPDCNITFKPNNGEPDTTIVVLTGEFIPRPQTPVKEGYTFIGWYTDEACTTAWNFEANKVEYHTTLYGGWEEIVEAEKYTITFKPNNGSADSTTEVEAGTLIPRPTLPKRDGYTFIGWYTDAECTQGWNFDIDTPTADMTLYGGWEKASDSGDSGYHSDFMGLVEALLSTNSNCMNNNDMIYNAVMASLTSKKRPKEDAPILHCSVNSVSGGTMSSIASFANSKLTSNLHFIFEVDPDPNYRDERLILYMYYEDDCDKANDGDEILVYKQIVSRGDDGVWFADGTYVGVATVGDYFGGGNSGKDVKTISPYTWKSTAKSVEE